jgi:signal-transduction protein with cAMP-binding, CBS, and nucleotidyltransferase domain
LKILFSRKSTWHGLSLTCDLLQEMSLFAVRLAAHVSGAVNREFLYVAANDCLGTLPPLTFFQDAVVEKSGEERSVFRLEETALNPLVDVGRVFGIAAGKAFGTSTLDRFAIASRLLPGDAAIFEEASITFRTVLWQQGRVGLAQRSSGAELPPALLSPYDRQVLRTGFQSILGCLNGSTIWNG